MYGKLAFRFGNSPAGFEPATYGIKAPNLYGIILGIIYRKKSEKSGPGRIRTCDLADNGFIPTRLYLTAIEKTHPLTD